MHNAPRGDCSESRDCCGEKDGDSEKNAATLPATLQACLIHGVLPFVPPSRLIVTPASSRYARPESVDSLA